MRFFAIGGLIAAAIVDRDAAGQRPPSGRITITDSGSTNRRGFRIVIDSDGGAEFVSASRGAGTPEGKPIRRKIPRSTINRLRSDLDGARPLSSLPAVPCMKSASFGSTLVIAAGGEHTPDLNCGDGDNARLRNLIRDAREIISLFPAETTGRPI